MATNNVSATTLITTKVLYNGTFRRFKIFLKDCGANTFPGKLKESLGIPENDEVLLERWSDSAASYIVLDSNKPAVYKQLYRAAKAKLKLRIKVTYPVPEAPVPQPFVSASSETLLPPYTATSLPDQPETTSLTAPIIPPSENQDLLASLVPNTPVPDVSGAVVAYLEGEEGRSKLRNTIVQEVEKEIEKRGGLAPSVASIPATQCPVTTDQPKIREIPGRQVYAVYCNVCDANVENVHYHCNICDDGDFDLCQSCMDRQEHCKVADHWMIKRTINNGEVISSTITVRHFPLPVETSNEKQVEEEPLLGRTCNCCCEGYEDAKFVECTVCPDYDLCLECHRGLIHGHDPSHEFRPACEETTLSLSERALLSPGRNFQHYAMCDGCDKTIYGVRYKCFNCPDWDYCSTCYKSANEIHPGHRFAALYGALGAPNTTHMTHHFGIYCDGPQCATKGYCSWIVGDRYKCAVCPDFDLCASCEASPLNKHNPTHPLIKFRTAVCGVTVQTLDSANVDQPLGDPQPRWVPPTTNAFTSVQTVAEVKPTKEVVVETSPEVESPQIVEAVVEEKEPEIDVYVNDRGVVLLVAEFAAETIPAGTVFKADEKFVQKWELVNTGPIAWPVGTTLQFIGGDAMSAGEATATTTKIEPGQSFEFSVELVAPAPTSRRLIGYWGLVTPCGVRFGSQLWCEIEVKLEIKEEPVVMEEKVTEKVEEEEIKEVKETQTETKAEEEEEISRSQLLAEEDLAASHTSQMIFPTLEKESPVASIANVQAEPAPSPAASNAEVSSAHQFEDLSDVASEGYSISDDDLEVFISDDEDYEVLTASDDEELVSNASSA